MPEYQPQTSQQLQLYLIKHLMIVLYPSKVLHQLYQRVRSLNLLYTNQIDPIKCKYFQQVQKFQHLIGLSLQRLHRQLANVIVLCIVYDAQLVNYLNGNRRSVAEGIE